MKDDSIRMAREAGKTKWYGTHPDGTSDFICAEFTLEQLKHFVALVIKPWADQLEVERKKFKELNDVAALGMHHARAAERDAIATMVEGLFDDPNDSVLAFIVDAIRASGTRPTTVIYSPGELAARGLTHEDVVKLIKENT